MVNKDDLIKIDTKIPFETSAQIALNGITAVALLQEARLKEKNFLLLNAASSSIATIIMQMAVRKGIKVIALVKNLKHESHLISLGVEGVFLQDDLSLSEKLLSLTNQQGIHAFLDAVGGHIVSTIIPLMANYSYVITYGNLSNSEKASFTNASIIYKNLTFIGFGIDYWLSLQPRATIQKLYNDITEQINSGLICFKPSVSISLSEFALNRVKLNASDKIIIV